ncbi:RagB/SusD family nutrient uptake outer membrane protein [Parabacteroides pacaensis]|uniref:RagB/SusD family nutrient uptake outer membrane protein n=1 Tax=Parabacteroides pacaensis TaxID=2086575 RepID=UPI000D113AB6|nr:RagB/SusD family nutrient uptake outer membrane protein [Parabacteroides pacaensis]
MKNTIFKYTLICLACSLWTGCSDIAFGEKFLEKAPGVDVTIDTIFSSKLYAERALISAYSTLRYGLTGPNIGDRESFYQYQSAGNKIGWDNLDALTDIMHSFCTWGGVHKIYYSGNYNPDFENLSFSSNYSTKYGFYPEQEQSWSGIRKAYIYIENVDRVPDMTEAEKTLRKAEAKMVIACHYHELMRHFGGIPFLFQSISPGNDMGTDYTRQTLEKTVDNIVNLCDEAAKDLPWRVAAEDDGRFCKAGALGLKIRVLLLAASPVFNASEPYLPGVASDQKMIWYGNYDQARWQKVITACEEFFQENGKNGFEYHLEQAEQATPEYYRKAFSKGYYERYNSEILIATCRYIPQYNGELYHGEYLSIEGYGGGCMTLNYVDKFPNADGTPASYRDWLAKHPDHIGGEDHNNPFGNRDPRLYESVLVNAAPYQGQLHGAEMYINGRQRKSESNPSGTTGFCLTKYIWDHDGATWWGKPTNYSYLRLPEIYLSYAEALNEVGRTGEAYQWINRVRNRVGLPNLTLTLLNQLHKQGSEKEKLREEILDERVREFASEETRWFDLVRWKKDEAFTSPLYGITVELHSGKQDDPADVEWTYKYSDPQELPARYWRTNWDRKWFFSAFPPDEINKGYGLVQNPGWE